MEAKTHYTTVEMAEKLGVKQTTLIRGLCLNGHYLGMKPLKLPNGRLLWPVADLEKLLSGEAAR